MKKVYEVTYDDSNYAVEQKLWVIARTPVDSLAKAAKHISKAIANKTAKVTGTSHVGDIDVE